MIVDTSALIAILAGEPEREEFVTAILADPTAKISAATLLETAIVVDRLRDPVLSRRLDDLIAALHITIAEVTSAHAEIGRAAYRDFGKGSGHPAQLNLGDCFSYALARQAGEPLLYKGDDFGHTDLQDARQLPKRAQKGMETNGES
jgi:ribonuclease VapC